MLGSQPSLESFFTVSSALIAFALSLRSISFTSFNCPSSSAKAGVKFKTETNANKVMVTDEKGDVVPSKVIPVGVCKCYTEGDLNTGEYSFVIEFPEEAD